MPELSFIRGHESAAPLDQGVSCSLTQNKTLGNVSVMLWEEARRIPKEDTLTMVSGFMGSYPNFFLDVDIKHLPDFVGKILNLTGEQAWLALAETYGLRRHVPISGSMRISSTDNTQGSIR